MHNQEIQKFETFDLLTDSKKPLNLKSDSYKMGSSSCNTDAYTFKTKRDKKSMETFRTEASLLANINISFNAQHFGYQWCQNDVDAITGEHGNIKWLSDSHMDFVCDSLRKQYPSLDGLHSPILYRAHRFPTVQTGKDFIQIIHNGAEHWVVLTNIGLNEEVKDKEIILYDSKIKFDQGSRNEVTPNNATYWQACQLVSNKSNSLTVNVRPCQQQDNGFDCGMYAVANAVSLALSLIHI